MDVAEKTYRDRDLFAGSGKGAGDENFPVGSHLIAKPLRPAVMAYYAFARTGDDIADDPGLTASRKVFQLDALDEVISGKAYGLTVAERAREALLSHNIRPHRASDLLVAFRQDAEGAEIGSLGDLRAYCRYSAEPVGRFLLDLHGESPALFPAADALCTVLQILNHLQDAKDDYLTIGRVYVPTEMLADEGLVAADLGRDAMSPALRQVFDRLLATCEPLLTRAAELEGLTSRRLRAESMTILCLARRLHRRLERGDPLARRIALGRSDFARAGLLGLFTLIRPSTSRPRP